MKNFLIDDSLIVDYNTLLEDINKQSVYYPVYKAPDLYQYYVNVLVALLTSQPLILIDLDLNNYELESMNINSDINKESYIPALSYETIDSVIKDVFASQSKITIFTSGTTGQPKKVIHSVSNLTRAVRKMTDINSQIWAFAYNPTHMAGLQVFFQALANQNTLINVFNKNRSTIYELIEEYNITHISATPTFYRLLIPVERHYPKVQRITLGGEKSDKKLYDFISEIFPNAKINNIYASTEAGSLFAAKGEYFHIPKLIADKIKIENDELLIHKSLLGQSDSFQYDNDYYRTGDLIEWIDKSNNTFKFKNRKNELINSGGYKINPQEVEEVILAIPGVEQCLVYGKPNSVLGNILCANIKKESQSNLLEIEIRRELSSKLQDFKIPRKIQFVNEFSVTRTGKIKRI